MSKEKAIPGVGSSELVGLLAGRWERRANELMSQRIYSYARRTTLAGALRDCAKELRAESEKQPNAAGQPRGD